MFWDREKREEIASVGGFVFYAATRRQFDDDRENLDCLHDGINSSAYLQYIYNTLSIYP